MNRLPKYWRISAVGQRVRVDVPASAADGEFELSRLEALAVVTALAGAVLRTWVSRSSAGSNAAAEQNESEQLPDRRLFTLDDAQWEAFIELLERPAVRKLRLEKLFAERSAFGPAPEARNDCRKLVVKYLKSIGLRPVGEAAEAQHEYDTSRELRRLLARAATSLTIRRERTRRTVTRDPGFDEEAHRQSALVAAASSEAEDQAWVDDISDFNDEAATCDSESEAGDQE